MKIIFLRAMIWFYYFIVWSCFHFQVFFFNMLIFYPLITAITIDNSISFFRFYFGRFFFLLISVLGRISSRLYRIVVFCSLFLLLLNLRCCYSALYIEYLDNFINKIQTEFYNISALLIRNMCIFNFYVIFLTKTFKQMISKS